MKSTYKLEYDIIFSFLCKYAMYDCTGNDECDWNTNVYLV